MYRVVLLDISLMLTYLGVNILEINVMYILDVFQIPLSVQWIVPITVDQLDQMQNGK